jgi:glycosyltransferase involved in cell wall biosynthesis
MTPSPLKTSEVRVSAVIHFLNAAQYLPESVASVFRQTFTDWELVLIDGGSTDGSMEMAREFEARFPDKVRTFGHEGSPELGVFSSRIWGAREARASVLALLDSDDEWHPQFLERHHAIYRAVFEQEAGMVFCPSVYWWEDPDLAHKSGVQPAPAPGLHRPPDLALEFLEQGYEKSPCNSGVMIGREIVVEAASLIGTAAEKLADDQYLWSHVALNHPIYVSPEPLVRYRQWPGSACARGAAAGETEASREAHLSWLLNHLTASYDGPEKRRMEKVVRSHLRPRRFLRSGPPKANR